MQIRINGVIDYINVDLHNKGRYQFEIEGEQDVGRIILYNVEAKDYNEIKLGDNVQIEVMSMCRYDSIDESFNVHFRRKCIVYVDDIYFECCAYISSINVRKL